jgi:hypothetical protein
MAARSPKSNIRVVVFSPHSHCVSRRRDCDKRAYTSTEKIYQRLIANGIDPAHITHIKHNTLRSDHDLNRFPSRGTEPRKQLREAIYKLYDDETVDRIYLLEMHSFPSGWEIPISGRNIVILNRPKNLEVGRALVDYLGGPAEGVELHPGTERCDIQTEFTPGRDIIVPFLIEISEDTTKFLEADLDDKLDQIAQFVARDIAGPIVEQIDIGEDVVMGTKGRLWLSAMLHLAKFVISRIIILIIIIIVFIGLLVLYLKVSKGLGEGMNSAGTVGGGMGGTSPIQRMIFNLVDNARVKRFLQVTGL